MGRFHEDKWEERFMQLAELTASWSKDPSTKVGTVITDIDKRVVGLGYNGFPRFVNDDPSRYEDKAQKYKMVVHAEANALINANRSVRDHAIYTTKYPCSECTKLIIQSGIQLIVTPPPSLNEPWATDATYSAQMLREAHVHVRLWMRKEPVL